MLQSSIKLSCAYHIHMHHYTSTLIRKINSNFGFGLKYVDKIFEYTMYRKPETNKIVSETVLERHFYRALDAKGNIIFRIKSSLMLNKYLEFSLKCACCIHHIYIYIISITLPNTVLTLQRNIQHYSLEFVVMADMNLS